VIANKCLSDVVYVLLLSIYDVFLYGTRNLKNLISTNW